MKRVALIVFNKDVSAFSDLIRNAVQAVSEHPNCIKFVGERNTTSFSYNFRHSDDSNRQIKLELLLFNFSQAIEASAAIDPANSPQ